MTVLTIHNRRPEFKAAFGACFPASPLRVSHFLAHPCLDTNGTPSARGSISWSLDDGCVAEKLRLDTRASVERCAFSHAGVERERQQNRDRTVPGHTVQYDTKNHDLESS